MEKSWEQSSKWYSEIVGKKGHYYHKHVIFPCLLELIDFSGISSVLDLACGQGVFSRQIPKSLEYLGVDLSKSLIQEAKRFCKNKNHKFLVKDLEKDLALSKKDFDVGLIILALQNIENRKKVFGNAQNHLRKNGKFYIVLNHPYFRIPKLTSWQVDEKKKVQYRRVDGYLSEKKIPILTNPSLKSSSVTHSYHVPFSLLTKELSQSGFVIERIDEWCSDKKSTGPKAKMEDRARNEFPLFMCITAIKL